MSLSELGEPFTLDLKGCARCHGDGHGELRFKPFTHPVEAEGGDYTHWAICPTTGEPILFREVDKPS